MAKWPQPCGKGKKLSDGDIHQTRTVLRTETHQGEGFNELRFEDQAGQEEIYIHGQKDLNVLIENDAAWHIKHDQHTDIGNERVTRISKVAYKDGGTSLGHDHLTVEGEKRDHIKMDYSLSVDTSMHQKLGQSLLVEAGEEVHHKAGMKIVMEAGAELTLLPLADQLRQLIEVESPYGSRILLKLAAPETMACLMVDADPWLWQGIAQVWLATRNGWRHWQAKAGLAARVGDKLKLTDGQWARLSEVSWQNQLDAAYRHMQAWFPARLSAQSDPQEWIARWAKQAYQLGFQSERDQLLFFNVLGFVGDGWWEGDDYPTLSKLLTLPSTQTPSQRVELAANWAEQHALPQELS